MTRIRIDCSKITDWQTFHDSFAVAFGFPEFYGRNMDAWIDCMTSLDCPDDGLTKIHAPPGGVVVLQLDNVSFWSGECVEFYNAVVECSAFVNWRKSESGEPAVLAVSFWMQV